MHALPTTSTKREDDSNTGRGLRFAVMMVLAVVVVAANLMLFRQIDVQLQRSHTADTDSTPWVLAQVEVDLLRYVTALQDVRVSGSDPEAVENLRLYYDLLYSRIAVVNRHTRVVVLPFINAPSWQAISGDAGLVARAQPIIDGPDADLVMAVPALLREAREATSRVSRDIAISMQDALRIVERQRNDLRASLQIFAAVSLGLLGIMAALMFTIHLQGRSRERHRLELAQAVYNLRTTIDSSLEAAVILDHDGRVIGCNSAGAQMFGWEEGGQIVRYFTDVLRDCKGGREGLLEIVRACAQGEDGAPGRITIMGCRQTGGAFPVEVSIAEARSAVGLPISIAFLRDISEQVDREENLRRARNDALQGEEAKSRFLAMMSHEMRTPLNGLLSAVEVLTAATRLDSKQNRLVGIIQTCGRATLEQVNNVLELTRLRSSDGRSYTESNFSLNDVLDSTVAQYSQDAERRGNTVTVHVTGTVPPQVTGQRQLLARVVANILSNAVKFTENGSIMVAMDVQPGSDPATCALRISVSDTGIGIADSDRDRIFRAFETLDASYARLQDGSGLGLGLAKLAAEAMGGRITVSSRPGEGSTFALFLTLPVAKPAEVPAGRLRPLSLLVVEDNQVNRELLVEILRLRGHRVSAAADGADGVACAEAERFDAILMDVSMPVMDGLEATRTIRAGTLSRDVPIIGITAHADPENRPRFMGEGMTEVLSKPVDLRHLEDMLALHVPHALAAAVPSAETARLRLVAVTSNETAPMTPEPRHSDLPHDLPPLLDEQIIDDLKETLGAPYMAKLANRFVQETDEALVAMGAHAAGGDLPGAAQVAHKNAGAAASLGLKALHRLFVVYERQAKAGDGGSADETRAMIERIRHETVEVLRERGLTA